VRKIEVWAFNFHELAHWSHLDILVGLPSIYKESLCKTCMVREHHNKLFNMGKAWTARKVMDFVEESDCGPMNIPIIGGCQVFFVYC